MFALFHSLSLSFSLVVGVADGKNKWTPTPIFALRQLLFICALSLSAGHKRRNNLFKHPPRLAGIFERGKEEEEEWMQHAQRWHQDM